MLTDPCEVPPPAPGPRRVLLIAFGWLFVGLAFLGALLPVLPTTPFLLLACGCFARSSPAANRWLLRSPLFGPLLLDWQRHRGVRPHVKWTAIVTILAAGTASIAWGGLSGPLLVPVVALLAIGLTVVLRLPLVRGPHPTAEDPPAAGRP